jgi:Carboxypeptidase regulatory-like domain
VTADAAMAVGGVLVGRTVTERRPRGIPDVCVRPYAGREGGPIPGSGGGCTGPDGVYRLTALPPGPVTVEFSPSYRSGLVGEWYLDQATQSSATVVDVALGSTTNLRPNKFTPGGTVTGVVTGPDGAPIEGAWVNLDGFYPGRAGPGEGQYTVETDAQGRYTLPAAPGTYSPFVYAVWQDFAPEWSGNATTRAAAAPLEVTAFRTTTFNVQLAPAAHLTGEVLDIQGVPTQMEGQIFTTSGDYIGDWFASPDNGAPITSTALPAGTFHLDGWIFENGWEEPPTTVWYDAASIREDATPVSLTVGETKEITFHLP